MNGDVHDSSNFGSLFTRNDSGSNVKRSSKQETMMEDLEDTMPGVIPTISNQVSNHVAIANGGMGGKHLLQRLPSRNGHIPNGRPNFRSMLEDAELDSHI